MQHVDSGHCTGLQSSALAPRRAPTHGPKPAVCEYAMDATEPRSNLAWRDGFVHELANILRVPARARAGRARARAAAASAQI